MQGLKLFSNLLAVILIGWCGLAGAQVTGDFYLEKTIYAVHEPVFVYFAEVNRGAKPERFYSADPNSECSDFWITVSTDEPRPSCLVGMSCPSGLVVLQPGQKRVERILLNLGHNLQLPGKYSVTADRLHFSNRDADIVSEPTALQFEIEPREAQPELLQPWVDQLHSRDLLKRFEAARVLASIAPPFLEDTLLAFINDPDLRQFAPLAFHRLNTEKSLKAMADLTKKSFKGTFEHWQAVAYLAHDKCADANWWH